MLYWKIKIILSISFHNSILNENIPVRTYWDPFIKSSKSNYCISKKCSCSLSNLWSMLFTTESYWLHCYESTMDWYLIGVRKRKNYCTYIYVCMQTHIDINTYTHTYMHTTHTHTCTHAQTNTHTVYLCKRTFLSTITNHSIDTFLQFR